MWVGVPMLVAMSLVSIGLIVGSGSAQPTDGDLVLATSTGTGFGFTAYLDPASPGILTTLAGSDPADRHICVRMAPDNLALVIGRGGDRYTWPGRGDLVNVRPGGALTTVLALPTSRPEGFELGHDGRWVVVANKPQKTTYPPLPALCELLGVRQIGGTGRQQIVSMQLNYNDVLIDRDPGPWQQSPYVVVLGSLSGPVSWPRVFRVIGPGQLSTLSPVMSGSVYGIELLPRSGDYLIAGSTGVFTLPKSGGALTTLLGNLPATGAKVTRTDEVWIAKAEMSNVSLLRYDLAQNAVTASFPVSLATGGLVESLEVYGSRRLLCYQPDETPRVVTVTLQSRKPGDGGKSYVLACSQARRPGLKFPNGEWLDLDVTDPLFLTTVLAPSPSIFHNFRGTTDASGNALATVNVPVGLPANLGITIFVAGVIYDNTGVLTVTNSHWFVLT